jgi:ankyrin repeat protein
VVKILLAHGARTDITDREGKTALDLAREQENTEIVRLLTEGEEGESDTEEAAEPE